MAEKIRLYLDDKQVATMVAENTDLRQQLDDARQNRGYTLLEIRKALGLRESPTDQELREEDFKDKSRVQNWRNYAASHRWAKMTDLERLLNYAQSVRAADCEEWD
jgi:hypothetical protein